MMAYWWVSQNKTYKEEKDGGYLWAPKKTKSGRKIHHWETMKDVRPGDIVFSYVGQAIVAVSKVEKSAYDSNKPFSKSNDDWEVIGRKVEATYKELSIPIRLHSIVNELQAILRRQSAYKPLDRNGSGNQGYLYSISDDAGKFILSKTQHKQ